MAFSNAPADTRNRSLILFYKERHDILTEEYTEFYLAAKGPPTPPDLQRVALAASTRMKHLLTLKMEDNATDDEFELLGNWLDDFEAVMTKVDEVKEEFAVKVMDEGIAGVKKFVSKGEASLPELKDAMRGAFRKGSDSQLKQLAFENAAILDSLLVAKDWLVEATTKRKDLRYFGAILRAEAIKFSWGDPNRYMRDVKNTRIGKVVETLDKLNKLVAIWQIADGAKSFFGGGKTTMDSALSGVSFAATLASAGGTLLGASSFFGLYNNIYIGPMVGKIVSQIDVLKDLISTHRNHPYMQWGKLEYVNWDLEPGGREMYEYMLEVSKASSSKSLPAMPASVRRYLSKYSDEFDAGLKGIDYDGNPYTPRRKLVYDDIDDKAAWVFNNREDIWAMLYGQLKTSI